MWGQGGRLGGTEQAGRQPVSYTHMDRRPWEEPEVSEEEHSLNASPHLLGQTSTFPPTQDASTGAS